MLTGYSSSDRIEDCREEARGRIQRAESGNGVCFSSFHRAWIGGSERRPWQAPPSLTFLTPKEEVQADALNGGESLVFCRTTTETVVYVCGSNMDPNRPGVGDAFGVCLHTVPKTKGRWVWKRSKYGMVAVIGRWKHIEIRNRCGGQLNVLQGMRINAFRLHYVIPYYWDNRDYWDNRARVVVEVIPK